MDGDLLECSVGGPGAEIVFAEGAGKALDCGLEKGGKGGSVGEMD